MSNKQLLDMLYNMLADKRIEATKEWDHYANLGATYEAKVSKGKFLAYTEIKEVIFDLYKGVL